MENYIFGIRPVIEAIKSGADIDKVLIKKDIDSANASELFSLAKEYQIVIQRVPQEKLNRITKKNHQGVVAFLSAITYHRLENLVPQLYEDGIVPFIVVLDGITDVRNFGAIARTCECAGVSAIVIPEKGSVSVGADAVKTSAGALLSIPVCRESSMNKAVRFLLDNGYSVISATEKASQLYTMPDYTVPTAIVMGNEETGISESILKISSDLVSIPQFGNIGSLNVSVAAGIMIYEVVNQRMKANMQIL